MYVVCTLLYLSATQYITHVGEAWVKVFSGMTTYLPLILESGFGRLKKIMLRLANSPNSSTNYIAEQDKFGTCAGRHL